MRKKTKAPKEKISTRTQKKVLGLLTAIFLLFFSWTTHHLTSVQLPDPGVATEIYASENRDNLQLLFRKAIDSAKESVLLFVYTLTDESIIDALKSKASEGVDVRVIVDAKASPYAEKKLGPKVNTLRRLGPGLMHCKILVVDKTIIWLGSANMTADSLQMHSNLVLGMHSPALAQLVANKADALPEAGKGTALPRAEFLIGNQTVETWFLPDESKNAVAEIKDLIKSAKKTIRVAMFTWTRYDFAYEIIRAANRGVDVQIVIDKNSGKGASANVVKLFKENGIRANLSKGTGLLHHKFMVVDGQTLVNGSANWTKAAFSTNDDCFVVINDLTEEQARKLENEWSILYADSVAP